MGDVNVRSEDVFKNYCTDIKYRSRIYVPDNQKFIEEYIRNVNNGVIQMLPLSELKLFIKYFMIEEIRRYNVLPALNIYQVSEIILKETNIRCNTIIEKQMRDINDAYFNEHIDDPKKWYQNKINACINSDRVTCGFDDYDHHGELPSFALFKKLSLCYKQIIFKHVIPIIKQILLVNNIQNDIAGIDGLNFFDINDFNVFLCYLVYWIYMHDDTAFNNAIEKHKNDIDIMVNGEFLIVYIVGECGNNIKKLTIYQMCDDAHFISITDETLLTIFANTLDCITASGILKGTHINTPLFIKILDIFKFGISTGYGNDNNSNDNNNNDNSNGNQNDISKQNYNHDNKQYGKEIKLPLQKMKMFIYGVYRKIPLRLDNKYNIPQYNISSIDFATFILKHKSIISKYDLLTNFPQHEHIIYNIYTHNT